MVQLFPWGWRLGSQVGPGAAGAIAREHYYRGMAEAANATHFSWVNEDAEKAFLHRYSAYGASHHTHASCCGMSMSLYTGSLATCGVFNPVDGPFPMHAGCRSPDCCLLPQRQAEGMKLWSVVADSSSLLALTAVTSGPSTYQASFITP